MGKRERGGETESEGASLTAVRVLIRKLTLSTHVMSLNPFWSVCAQTVCVSRVHKRDINHGGTTALLLAAAAT